MDLGEDQLLLTGSHPTIVASWNPNEAKLTLTIETNHAVQMYRLFYFL